MKVSKITIISANIFAIALVGTITSNPACANSFKNTSFTDKPNQNKLLNRDYVSLFSRKNEELKLPPSLQKILGKNDEIKHKIKSNLFQEVENVISEAKQASTVTQETIDGKIIYLYNLESTKPGKSYQTNQLYSRTYLIRYKLPTPPIKRKVSEPTNVIALIATFCFFTTQQKLFKRG
ncbi:hypothetical protein [Brunnivagina elsteri]|uniref:Uncharacterized protein n=1 Tax=Brunnivagina elsteri CCALA 953 TaxID=987040 RepID=A0A2A2TKZ7_9CYAN|nr:hypothetical protein [Calothrix elsteri]PAX57219.1 hypothetical protein CK510_08855 [Calothrix elsteri CCALA 953]